MKALLVPRCPTQEWGRHTYTAESSILTDAYSVAMQTHCYTSIGISEVNEVFWHIKIIANDACEYIIGFLVGRIGSPVCQSQHLLLADVIGEHRRIMPLHD